MTKEEFIEGFSSTEYVILTDEYSLEKRRYKKKYNPVKIVIDLKKDEEINATFDTIEQALEHKSDEFSVEEVVKCLSKENLFPKEIVIDDSSIQVFKSLFT